MPLPTAGREQLASCLVTTLNYVKQEDDLQRSDDLLVELREILLVDLRELHKAWPQDAPVREWLAKGLFTALNYANKEGDLQRLNDLLVELRELHKAWPKDAPVREQLARGLFNAFFCAKQENDLQRRDDLLVELRELHQRCPEDPVLRDLVNFVS
jgi:hypothetical protein